MREYHIDLRLNLEISNWIMTQGATVIAAEDPYDSRKPVVMFSGRQIHFMSGSKDARVFFNDDTVGSALLLLMLWPQNIYSHTIPEEHLATR